MFKWGKGVTKIEHAGTLGEVGGSKLWSMAITLNMINVPVKTCLLSGKSKDPTLYTIPKQ